MVVPTISGKHIHSIAYVLITFCLVNKLSTTEHNHSEIPFKI